MYVMFVWTCYFVNISGMYFLVQRNGTISWHKGMVHNVHTILCTKKQVLFVCTNSMYCFFHTNKQYHFFRTKKLYLQRNRFFSQRNTYCFLYKEVLFLCKKKYTVSSYKETIHTSYRIYLY